MLNFFKLVLQVALLFLIYFIGTWIQIFFQLPIPGSMIGLIIMFLLLNSGILKLTYIETGSKFMITHLVLFFLPATVGILNYYGLFKGKGILLILVTVFSTSLVMISAGLTSQILSKQKDFTHE